jgi:hypothetical protein
MSWVKTAHASMPRNAANLRFPRIPRRPTVAFCEIGAAQPGTENPEIN